MVIVLQILKQIENLEIQMVGIILLLLLIQHKQQHQIELKLYVNGVQETSFSTEDYPAQNVDLDI